MWNHDANWCKFPLKNQVASAITLLALVISGSLRLRPLRFRRQFLPEGYTIWADLNLKVLQIGISNSPGSSQALNWQHYTNAIGVCQSNWKNCDPPFKGRSSYSVEAHQLTAFCAGTLATFFPMGRLSMPPDSQCTVRCITHRGTAVDLAFSDLTTVQSRLGCLQPEQKPRNFFWILSSSFSNFPTNYFGIRQLLRRCVNSDMCACVYVKYIFLY